MNRELLQRALDALETARDYTSEIQQERHAAWGFQVMHKQKVIAEDLAQADAAIAELRAELAKGNSYGWPAKHIKTGNIYTVTGEATNCTNAENLEPMVIYRNAAGQTFVRNTAEFQEKFAAIFDGTAST